MPKIVGHTPNPSTDADPISLLWSGEAALLMNPLNCEFPVLGFVIAGGEVYFAWEREPGSDALRLVVEYLTEHKPAALEPEASQDSDYDNLDSGIISPRGTRYERGVYKAMKAACREKVEAFESTGDQQHLLPFEAYFVDDDTSEAFADD